MATTSLSIGLTVVVLHFYHVGPNQRPIPPAIRKFFFGTVSRYLHVSTNLPHHRTFSTSVFRAPSGSFSGDSLNVESPLNSFLRQCKPLLRHYKYNPPPQPQGGHNGDLLAPPSPLMTKTRGDLEACRPLDEPFCLPPPPPELWDDAVDEDGSGGPLAKEEPPQNRNGSAKKAPGEHSGAVLYEQIAKHLRALIEKQEAEEKHQDAVNDWRLLAYILDRCLFYFFLLTCTFSSVIILGLMPMTKPNLNATKK